MSVGLYDMDIASYLYVPPNLEIMKLSAYYKRKREVVVLSPSFTPERNSTFILRKDYNDGNVPKNISEATEYGGLAFTNNVYDPLPIEIERMPPDPTIYSRLERQFTNSTRKNKKLWHDIVTAEHVRLSLDGKTIWPDYKRQFHQIQGVRSIIFHDYDVGAINGSYEEIKSLLEFAQTTKLPVRLGTKFPIQVSNGADLIKWSMLPTNSLFYGVTYLGFMPHSVLKEYVKLDCDKAAFTQMSYNVTRGCSSENDFLVNLLPQIFRQVLISRTFGAYFSLIYDEGFFVDRRWERVLDLFHLYLRSGASCIDRTLVPRNTLFDFCKNMDYTIYKKTERTMEKKEARELFRFVQEQNPALFKDFYECSYNSLKGGLELV